MDAAIDFFEAFRPPHLQEVTCSLSSGIVIAMNSLCGTDESELPCEELEEILLKFPRPSIVFASDDPLHPRRQRFWTRELGRYFPTLLERNAFVLTASLGMFGFHGRSRPITIT